MPFLLTEILNFQGSTHLIGVGSFSELFEVFETEVIDEDLQELEKDMMEGDVENE